MVEELFSDFHDGIMGIRIGNVHPAPAPFARFSLLRNLRKRVTFAIVVLSITTSSEETHA